MSDAPNLNDVYLRIGELHADVKHIIANQVDHQIRDDHRHTETQAAIVKLTEHVNHENELMLARVGTLEDEHETRIAGMEEKHKERKISRQFWQRGGQILLALVMAVGTLLLVDWPRVLAYFR